MPQFLCTPPILGDIPTTGKYNFPQLAQVNYLPEEPVYPLNSTVAVTTNCLGRDREAHRLFVGGINAMIEKIHPTAIVVCGKVPDWLPKRHADIRIVHIPGYSEMWQSPKTSRRLLLRQPQRQSH